jgi:DNA-binding CsgD family transcriptional regulator
MRASSWQPLGTGSSRPIGARRRRKLSGRGRRARVPRAGFASPWRDDLRRGALCPYDVRRILRRWPGSRSATFVPPSPSCTRRARSRTTTRFRSESSSRFGASFRRTSSRIRVPRRACRGLLRRRAGRRSDACHPRGVGQACEGGSVAAGRGRSQVLGLPLAARISPFGPLPRGRPSARGRRHSPPLARPDECASRVRQGRLGLPRTGPPRSRSALLPHLRQLQRNAARRSSAPGSTAGCLTPREREILALVAEGMTSAEVAKSLWISSGTVRKHLENAYEKPGVHTRTAAVAAAIK